MNIRTFQPGDEATQAALFNVAAFALPGFKAATAEDVKRRTRARGFDPGARFYAEEGGQVVGYCVLEPDQGRVSVPWCRKGFESAAGPLLDTALAAARARGLNTVFAAYRRDWEPVLTFLADRGFVVAREIVNFWADPVDLPTLVNRSKLPIDRLRQTDLPAVAAMGRGLLRLPDEKLESYFFANPYFPAEALLVLRGADDAPVAIGIGLESSTYADVKKVDPNAPCFRLGAFGTEGLNTKRVNGLFSFMVADPGRALTAGLALLSEASQEMTEGTVTALAAQCPSDAPHLTSFYTRYFKEHGRFPVLEKRLA
ncbi:Uncharacterized protein OS=Singulisphaera acidiphila (strain ATCC BAA-1392 / DSM 18658 / VKM B-2454 / MOB10) GN=Sinac_5816 PE=4 SV=1 [Gemmata massiliana]|uniref:N-acetyltransferase domain-containing protein n=1 Tax=Gemmata massiliana TaxID=1210884 RepID=A0A6P2DAI2_9BACT|nr:hypothetical protein [Gemmata massiliana]VTR97365.1 Uncharacterized protein OS=Singulisphaera acidiphila (strain ATCC BAA-1392 / DSM 18658 / VKM B-2454 / MOB10) GN=Sinac_5816 PE=4 SV=1 [Gemmata massiliana]